MYVERYTTRFHICSSQPTSTSLETTYWFVFVYGILWHWYDRPLIVFSCSFYYNLVNSVRIRVNCNTDIPSNVFGVVVILASALRSRHQATKLSTIFALFLSRLFTPRSNVISFPSVLFALFIAGHKCHRRIEVIPVNVKWSNPSLLQYVAKLEHEMIKTRVNGIKHFGQFR